MNKKNPSEIHDFRGILVRVVRLERTVSWSQTRRDTNFAIPGYSLFCHDTTAREKIKDFSVCGHSCGQSRFYAIFGNRVKSRNRRCCKALRRFSLSRPGYRHGTPKCRALPVEPHPDIQFLPLYHVEEDNQSFSCPRPFLWANSFLHRTRQSAEIPQTQTPQGFPAVRLTQFRILPRCSQAQLSRSVCP